MQISKYKTKMVIAVETHSMQQKRRVSTRGEEVGGLHGRRRFELGGERCGVGQVAQEKRGHPFIQRGICQVRGAQEGMGYSGAINNSPRLELECWGGGGEWGAGGEGVAGSWREKTGPVYQAIFVLC